MSNGTLALPQSRLSIEDGYLIRRHPKTGQVVGKHRLTDLDSAEITTRWDPLAIVIGAALLSGAGFAKLNIESAGWSWGTCVTLGVLGLLMVIGSYQTLLQIALGGETACYDLFDDPTDCQGFVMTLHSMRHDEEAKGAFVHSGEPSRAPARPHSRSPY